MEEHVDLDDLEEAPTLLRDAEILGPEHQPLQSQRRK